MSEQATTAPTEASPIPTSEAAGGFIDSIDTVFSDFDAPSEASTEPGTPQPESFASDVEPQSDDHQQDAQPLEADPLGEIDERINDWTPQAARRFKELKSELKTTKQLLQEREQALIERESRLKELDAVANNPALEEMQTRLSEYEQRLLVSDLESSPIYQELIQQPMGALVDEAYLLAEKYEIDGDALIDAIALEEDSVQEEHLSELLAMASDRDKFRVYKIIEELKPILHQRQVLRENAQEALREAEELKREQERQRIAERYHHRAQTANTVADKLRSKISFVESIDGVNLKELAKEAASVDPSSLDDVTSTYQVMTSKIFPKLVREFVALRAELDNMTERLAEYDRAVPRAGGGSPRADMSPASQNKSFVDAITAAFG